ncbi:MAG: hypothetical protein Q9195_007885 [Heterodermia aff. obscurata]
MTDEHQSKSHDTPIHVLDLPQIYTHPSASILLQTLTRLEIKPSSWSVGVEHDRESGEDVAPIDEYGIPKYLTSIISNELQWVEDDDERERVWEAASARLSERSGRTDYLFHNWAPNQAVIPHDPFSNHLPAQPNLSRTFIIPQPSPSTPPVHITLLEPSLTGDNLGHKTWLSAYLLALRLPSLLSTLFPINNPLHILELGAGTGLLGLTAAVLLPRAATHLTDLPAIIANLTQNIHANTHLFASPPSVGALDWSEPATTNEKYDLIIASDPLYSPQHPAWLVDTISRQLSTNRDARVVIELPLRDAYLAEVHEMRKRMLDAGLGLLDSGEEVGREDWGSDHGVERAEVRCWWGVWGWA